jgi:hypothetical protein
MARWCVLALLALLAAAGPGQARKLMQTMVAEAEEPMYLDGTVTENVDVFQCDLTLGANAWAANPVCQMQAPPTAQPIQVPLGVLGNRQYKPGVAGGCAAGACDCAAAAG